MHLPRPRPAHDGRPHCGSAFRPTQFIASARTHRLRIGANLRIGTNPIGCDAGSENRPKGSALQTAAKLGASRLDEQQYRRLQTPGEFDTKTSSWISTPAEVRRIGGALSCDRRFGRTLVCHRGAESHYAARGFRGGLEV
ncbi:MAG TPA: DUF4256 domain-containing protein [Casimicrobiaceae bacterium]|nr:DUF4256 domain-containing protein [Casimicrobiaceae bacterium]